MIALQRADAPPPEYPWPVEADRTVLVADEGSGPAGVVVGRTERGVVTLERVWSAPGRDLDVALLDAAAAEARDRGAATLVVEVAADQPALLALLQDAPVLSTSMTKPAPAAAPDLPAGFAARPMTPAEFAAWRATAVEEYSVSNLERSGGDRTLALQRSHDSYDRLLPGGADSPDTSLLALTQDGERVGELWARHHWPRHAVVPTPDETFVLDVAIEPEHRGRGLGRAAMLLTERVAVAAGDTRIGLNVFGGNTVAIGLYRSQGFTAATTVFDVTARL